MPGLEAYHGKNIYLTEALTLEAIKAVEKAVADQQPFYLYMAHYAVHAPWEKDDRFYQKYLDAGLKPFEATLASMIEGMDKSLGDLMATLDRLGVADNTIILFMSDNGSPSQCPPNLPLRGHKLTPYEGGIREPMIVKWPGVTKPGTVCREPVVIEDFFPTILELAGADWRGQDAADGGRRQLRAAPEGRGQDAGGPRVRLAFPAQLRRPDAVQRDSPRPVEAHLSPRRPAAGAVQHRRRHQRDARSGEGESRRSDEVWRDCFPSGSALMDALMPLEKVTGRSVDFPDALPGAGPGEAEGATKAPNPSAKEGDAASREADVWLLGGQSNMQGIGKIADLPGDLTAHNSARVVLERHGLRAIGIGEDKDLSAGR